MDAKLKLWRTSIYDLLKNHQLRERKISTTWISEIENDWRNQFDLSQRNLYLNRTIGCQTQIMTDSIFDLEKNHQLRERKISTTWISDIENDWQNQFDLSQRNLNRKIGCETQIMTDKHLWFGKESTTVREKYLQHG